MSRFPFLCPSGVVLTLLAGGCISFGEPPAPLPEFIPATRSVQPKADLRVEIHSPQRDTALASWESAVEVTGGASVFGGVRHIELMLAIDTSKSLRRMDPRDYRVAGAMGLVKSLPEETDIRVGLVDFDSKAKLVSALTSERSKVLAAIRRLDRDGTTNLAAGIRTALRELERAARPDSTKVVLLFTDGKSNQDKARRAMEEARAQAQPGKKLPFTGLCPVLGAKLLLEGNVSLAASAPKPTKPNHW